MPNTTKNKDQLKSDKSRMMGHKVATKDQYGSHHNQDNREPKVTPKKGPNLSRREEKQDIRTPRGANVKAQKGEISPKVPGLRARRPKSGSPGMVKMTKRK